MRRLCLALFIALSTALYGFGGVSAAEQSTAPVPSQAPDPNLDEGPVDIARRGESVPRSGVQVSAPSVEDAAAYLEAVITNADQEWSSYFVQAGLQEPFVSYWIVQPGQAFQSTCGLTVSSDTPNAYYCPTDESTPGYVGGVWLPATTFLNMWNGDVFGRASSRQGDFAAGIVAAHEFGHHIVDEFRIQLAQRDGVQYAPPSGKYKELIADCMAGIWAASLYYQGRLDAGDFEEASEALFAIGDTQVGGSDPHGTGAERAEAMAVGYHGIKGVTRPADPDACIQKYWVV